ncbi:hypothetical protein, partial [Candidatus Binatus sp.]|uniref:hypothetical protein n=1 Tax=Candidatus Binatus sp. TaxID=2811406 RepID=UPI003C6F3FBE
MGDRPRWRVARAPFSRWGAVTLAVFSIAAASDPGSSSGKFTGFVAGAILIALVALSTFFPPDLKDEVRDPAAL